MSAKLKRRLLLAALLGLVLAGCAPKAPPPERVADRGMGGTGISEEDRGMGGTGVSTADRGIGGTGIVGTITGFASILVNGLEVDFDPSTPIAGSFGPMATGDLRVGQVVAIEARQSGGRLQADAIELIHEVSGPITRVDPATGTIEILGQTVTRPAGNALAGAGDLALQDLAPGQWVEVSGLRDADGAIVASRIDARQAGGPVALRGIARDVAPDRFRVGGLPVVSRRALPAFETGRAVLVTGRLSDRGLEPDRLRVEPRTPFGGRLRNLSLEGFVRRSDVAGRFGLGRFDLTAPSGPTAFRPGSRVQIDGTLGPRGAITTERVRVLPKRRTFERRMTPPAERRGLERRKRSSGEGRPVLKRERAPGAEGATPDRARPKVRRVLRERTRIDRPRVPRPTNVPGQRRRR